MKRIMGVLMFSLIIGMESMGAGYSVLPWSNTKEFMEGVRSNHKKYTKVLLDEREEEFETYVYRLDFQIIAQIVGKKHVATVSGPASSPENIELEIEKAKSKIRALEGQEEYALKKKDKDPIS